jgi:hypothetical protein
VKAAQHSDTRRVRKGSTPVPSSSFGGWRGCSIATFLTVRCTRCRMWLEASGAGYGATPSQSRPGNGERQRAKWRFTASIGQRMTHPWDRE